MTESQPVSRPTAALPIGVDSGYVMTVCGPVPVDEMGVTLMHEHILLDASNKWVPPSCCAGRHIGEQKVHIGILGALRMNPLMNRDNCRLVDVDLAVDELMKFRERGGTTVVDPTNIGIGRDPLALQEVSRRTGLHVVMSTGFYLESSHPPYVRERSIEELAGQLMFEVGALEQRPDVIAGVIGEIGVSAAFTAEETKSLRAAARASAATGVPLSIHLPGWARHGHRVLDIVEAEGADLHHTVLCHMNPSHADPGYQHALARRGAWLEYDMIGMDYYYADEDAQSPSDEENARAIRSLIDAGYIDRLLMSQDVFLKMMLTHYGGFGYGYILEHFVPRLRRHGVTDEQIDTMLVANPARVFSRRACAGEGGAHSRIGKDIE
ncbi:phosphotriesterase-related protein [Paraburkholderia sp. SARCC-3016]|uniref:phosphotriesterase family protein n=1 Tax=Paraburkholderia sp. SARCC-3016 TaxID=3058611 RepID=UPI002807B109|nr:phosphotriesterase-related protein [Paraburkholderia sp. SARCC-3016]MDQ7976877.1 phosphotriesterase-related protein [Paraburkholderia sp. SARCC-3016]